MCRPSYLLALCMFAAPVAARESAKHDGPREPTAVNFAVDAAGHIKIRHGLIHEASLVFNEDHKEATLQIHYKNNSDQAATPHFMARICTPQGYTLGGIRIPEDCEDIETPIAPGSDITRTHKIAIFTPQYFTSTAKVDAASKDGRRAVQLSILDAETTPTGQEMNVPLHPLIFTVNDSWNLPTQGKVVKTRIEPCPLTRWAAMDPSKRTLPIRGPYLGHQDTVDMLRLIHSAAIQNKDWNYLVGRLECDGRNFFGLGKAISIGQPDAEGISRILLEYEAHEPSGDLLWGPHAIQFVIPRSTIPDGTRILHFTTHMTRMGHPSWGNTTIPPHIPDFRYDLAEEPITPPAPR